jgi:hypothetical protein
VGSVSDKAVGIAVSTAAAGEEVYRSVIKMASS